MFSQLRKKRSWFGFNSKFNPQQCAIFVDTLNPLGLFAMHSALDSFQQSKVHLELKRVFFRNSGYLKCYRLMRMLHRKSHSILLTDLHS